MRSAGWKFWTNRFASDVICHAVGKARTFVSDGRGNIAIISALILPVLIGIFALGFETSYWDQTQRSMQNAADSAASAAATNGTNTYATEAKAVASLYGFADGSNSVTVAASNAAACPSGGNTCYSVTITKTVPLFMAQVAGYHGDGTYNGGFGKQLTATAVAKQAGGTRNYCILALASSGATGIQANGVPFANLNGCNVMSNSSSTCNGHDLGAGFGDAHGTNSGCGVTSENGLPVVSDPYASLATNIPSNTCGSTYPQEDKHGSIASTNQYGGAKSWGNTVTVCGDMKLTSNLTITNSGSSPTVLVIENGQLDTNGFTIATANGSQATIVFSGDNGSYTHAPTGGGTLDIQAPTSGTWSGVAVYQDPALTSGVDISAAGNSPTWDITGLVYLPHSSVTFSGIVNKSSNGASCFDLVVDNITVNGTGQILNEGQCPQAGLSMPTATVGGRGGLVN
ncbi:MAG TPA: pilus assembly protein TadG-related protein [Caulobacteraceae bacterium]|jgi:hypothetical protein|nr:pilus assembly protein TadG-related protein [Caulobacteraceae bacterium]